jgi:hypothetical protein
VTLLLLLTGCAPSKFEPYRPPEIKYDKLQDYDIKEALNNIPKPDKLVPIYVKLEGTYITQLTKEQKDQATHILLAPNEYAKVGAVVKLAGTYKEIVIEQESLVNTYIAQINALREMIALERQKALLYRELWVDSENAYRQEKYEHDRDNTLNRTGMYIITIGSVIALALAL